MTTNHTHYMHLAIEEARIGEAEGNQPVGSLLVWGGEVISRGHNLALSTLDVTAHAETVTLRNAGPATGVIEFPDATLYTTFQPCPMCLGAIMTARVSTLVLGGMSNLQGSTYGDYTMERLLKLAGWSDKLTLVTGVLDRECEEMSNEWRRRHLTT